MHGFALFWAFDVWPCVTDGAVHRRKIFQSGSCFKKLQIQWSDSHWFVLQSILAFVHMMLCMTVAPCAALTHLIQFKIRVKDWS